ncbi:MAG: type II toxin-antitoxin system RelE/ParE family toxin [Sphingobacteriales bacterium]|nr:type II toxin-antitoxin system RelE/ParE family toxin [Sphingobacteriales bacterium]MBI3719376.1 type II toxin-antitoxin system RelE/ParE family toxin [Sphingobacteriales bacterium]
MGEVRFTEQSVNDLEEIGRYISLDSTTYARLQIEKIISRTDILEIFPRIGRVVPELNNKSVREIIEGNFRIIYLIVNKQTVHILTIHHSARRFNATQLRKLIRKIK